ncbi:type IV pilus biogenesis protein PilP [Salmonella enterica subsp. enterica]|nr:type IV pilus biogenesis protein PilP [Salmonella enterica subsp. enterica serovar Hvittingfoss]EEJ7166083.1 type IV pilus biogenesis protein PilP [Salmonella enterica subsp. enterica serovar Hvittingfoss]
MRRRGIFMPVRNRAATAAVSATTILILLALAGPGARADADTAVPGTGSATAVEAAGTSPVTVSPETGATVVTAGSDVATAATGASASTPPVPPPGSITLGMLEQIQQKNLLLAAQVQTAQLQRQLAEADSEASASTGNVAVTQPGTTLSSAAVPGIPGQQEGRALSRTPVVPRPQVLEISGKDNTLYALLQMPDGSQPEVTRGSRVSIGKTSLTVSWISLTGVMLSDGSELSF